MTSETTYPITTRELLAISTDLERQLQWLWLGMNSISDEAKVKLNLLEVQRCLEQAIDAIGENEDDNH